MNYLRKLRRPRMILLAGLILFAWWGGRAVRHAAWSAEPDPTLPIPGGTAWLGSGDREKGFGYVIGGPAAWRGRWFQSERKRRVTLPPYRMDRTLVTQGAYARFVAETSHHVPHISEAEYLRQGFLVHPYQSVLPYLWRGGKPPPGKADHPVVLVSQSDGAAYCRWRGGQRRRACRLPSEDEWEFAARGTDGRYFPWGDRWEPHRLNTAARGPYGTTPVLAYPNGRSPFGLHDMAGNVFEWTATPGPAGSKGRTILKSCSWDDLGGICRSAARHGRPPESRHILFGFRCLCESGGLRR